MNKKARPLRWSTSPNVYVLCLKKNILFNREVRYLMETNLLSFPLYHLCFCRTHNFLSFILTYNYTLSLSHIQKISFSLLQTPILSLYFSHTKTHTSNRKHIHLLCFIPIENTLFATFSNIPEVVFFHRRQEEKSSKLKLIKLLGAYLGAQLY